MIILDSKNCFLVPSVKSWLILLLPSPKKYLFQRYKLYPNKRANDKISAQQADDYTGTIAEPLACSLPCAVFQESSHWILFNVKSINYDR